MLRLQIDRYIMHFIIYATSLLLLLFNGFHFFCGLKLLALSSQALCAWTDLKRLSNLSALLLEERRESGWCRSMSVRTRVTLLESLEKIYFNNESKMVQVPECFDYKYQNALTTSTRMLWGALLYSIFFFFCEESLVSDTNLHYKDYK